MIINYILLKQNIVIKIIKILQNIIRTNRNYGFWVVSVISFISSPFITNDGLCLLLVTPVLDAFSFSDTDKNMNDDNMNNYNYDDNYDDNNNDNNNNKNNDNNNNNNNDYNNNNNNNNNNNFYLK